MCRSIYVAWASAAVLGLSASTLAADAPAAGERAATLNVAGTWSEVLPKGLVLAAEQHRQARFQQRSATGGE